MIKDPRTQPSIAYSLLLPATVHAECCSLNIGWENMIQQCLCDWGMTSGQNLLPKVRPTMRVELGFFLFVLFLFCFFPSSWAPVSYFGSEDRS